MSEIVLRDVLNSKIYVKPNSAIIFKEPEAYISPFIDILAKTKNYDENNIRVKVTEPVINQNVTGEKNIAYSRVGIEYDQDIFVLDNNEYRSTIGFMYALDTNKPIMKIYAGINVSSCLNLNIWNADMLYQMELFGNTHEIYGKAREYTIANYTETFTEKFNRLQNSILGEADFYRTLGNIRSIVIREKSILGIQMINNAEKLMFNPTSKYYVGNEGYVETTEWNVLNSITQAITDDKEFIIRPNKTLAAWKLFIN